MKASFLIALAVPFAALVGCSDAYVEPSDPALTFRKDAPRRDAGEDPDDDEQDAGTDGGAKDGQAPVADGGSGFSYKPSPAGCVTNVAPGDHTFTCEGLTVDVTIPDMAAKCPAAGCGLVLELHGDTGTGPLLDAHTQLRARGAKNGFIVIAPTGPAIGSLGSPPVAYPGSSWNAGTDAKLVAITQTFASVFKPNPARVHVTGFSRGGFAGWRLACDHSDLFASVAIGGAGNGASPLGAGPFSSEATCFEGNRYPARSIDILMLMGRTDALYNRMVSVRTNARTKYGLVDADVADVGVQTTMVSHRRATRAGKGVIEWFEHGYEVNPANGDPLGKIAKGHCIPGSSVPLSAPLYNIACRAPNAIDWGAEVLAFFAAHPKP